jgi:hypothetical protein
MQQGLIASNIAENVFCKFTFHKPEHLTPHLRYIFKRSLHQLLMENNFTETFITTQRGLRQTCEVFSHVTARSLIVFVNT